MDPDEVVFQNVLPLGDRCFVSKAATISSMNPHFCVAGFYICYICDLERYLAVIRSKGYISVFIFVFVCDEI